METITEQEAKDNDLKHVFVKRESKLKEIIVDYVGEVLHPQEPKVTVEDVVKIFADEFPEFLSVVAEENFIRGYQQAFQDINNKNA